LAQGILTQAFLAQAWIQIKVVVDQMSTSVAAFATNHPLNTGLSTPVTMGMYAVVAGIGATGIGASVAGAAAATAWCVAGAAAGTAWCYSQLAVHGPVIHGVGKSQSD